MAYYNSFTDYIKANVDDAEYIIKHMDNPTDREILNQTMQWLISQYKDASDLLERVETAMNKKLGESMTDEILKGVALEQAKANFKHSIGDWEFQKLFEEDADSKNQA